ncbi:condensation domain-containing protein [Micromonospora sp. NPDC051196]|uniref:condensation domain-containing protein n=1 Tax=Micromonospora sp. NPDC051196 TaxID=3155281 RepID=UPI0034338122
MSDPLAAQLAGLTPEQQRLFLQRLRIRRRRQSAEERPAAPTASWPLSHAQERLWLLETLTPGDPAYTVPFAIRIAGPLDRSALETAIRAVLDRHGALRTVIVEEGPAQVVREDLHAALAWTDLSGLPAPERAPAFDRLAAEHGVRTFDLTTGPPVALHAVRLSDRETVLLAAVHHIVFDATSVTILLDDLAAAYDDAVAGRHATSAGPGYEFGEHCAAERAADRERGLTYWTETLRGAPPLSTLPAARTRAESRPGGLVPLRLPAGRTNALFALLRAERVTRYAALLAVSALALRRANGQDTVVVGVPASTRTRPELARVVGCFYNPQALRLDLGGDPTVRELLHRAHRAVGAAQANADVPFGDVVRALRATRSDRHNPLFQTMLSLLDAPAEERHGGGVRFTLGPAPAGRTDMDLFVTVTVGTDGGLVGSCRFAGHLDEPDVAAWAADLTGLLDRLADGTDQQISRFAPIPDVVRTSVAAPADAAYRAPGTPAEALLAAVWARVLGVDRVGADDNFFQLGGDSMQVVQVIAEAAVAGLSLSPGDLLRHPTVAGLAALGPRQPRGRQTVLTGDVPPTPAQAWFLTEILPHLSRPGHFNHPYHAELLRPVTVTELSGAVTELARRHDALRLRLVPDGDGPRRQISVPDAGPVPFDTHDLRDVDVEKADRLAANMADAAQRGLSLSAAPMRAVHFRMPGGLPDRLLLICHHLLIDGFSRTLLMNDLADLLDPDVRPVPPSLPYAAWARLLQDAATAPELTDQRAFWRAQARAEELPVDLPGTVVRFGSRAGVRRVLAADVTARLAADARAAGTGLSDLLLAAAAVAVAGWQGGDELTVALAAPGRNGPPGHDVDVTRTVGWFQYFYPLRLRLGRTSSLPQLAGELRQQIGAVPMHGLGHGLLTYAHPDPAVREELARSAGPQVSFNYLGEIGSWDRQPAARILRPSAHPSGTAQDPQGRWPYLLDIAGELREGRLRFVAHHGTGLHRTATVEGLVDEIVRLLNGGAR